MKLPCSIVRDLLPLYHDNVCAPESAAAVEEHLTGCESCQEFYHSLQDEKKLALVPLAPPPGVSALQRVKRRMRMKYFVIALSALLVFGGMVTGIGIWLNSATIDVPPEAIGNVGISDHSFTAKEENGDLVQTLDVVFTDWRYAQYGISLEAVPLQEEGRQEWALLISSRVTWWQALCMRLSAFLPVSPEAKYANECPIPTTWDYWEGQCERYVDNGLAEPPKDRDCMFSRAYFIPDYDLFRQVDGLPPEAMENFLSNEATLLWERDKDPAAK